MQLVIICKGRHLAVLTKTWRVVRILSVLLFIFSMQVSANLRSQTVSFSGKNVPLETVIKAIEKQTGYYVFCNQQLLQDAQPVTLKATNVALPEFLALALDRQPLDFFYREQNNRTAQQGFNASVTIVCE